MKDQRTREPVLVKNTRRRYLKVFYDSSTEHDYDRAISEGLAAFGLKQGIMNVIAYPDSMAT